MKNFCAFTYARENGSQLTRLGTFVGGKIILTCALKVLLCLDIFFYLIVWPTQHLLWLFNLVKFVDPKIFIKYFASSMKVVKYKYTL